MDIKLNIKMKQVARAIKADMPPIAQGQLVFAWDNDNHYIVCGAHIGYDNCYDSETGKLVYRHNKVEVYSWCKEDQGTHVFDNAVCVCDDDLPLIITENGTGRLCGISGGDCQVFDFKDRTVITVPKDSVVMFDWQKLKGDN